MTQNQEELDKDMNQLLNSLQEQLDLQNDRISISLIHCPTEGTVWSLRSEKFKHRQKGNKDELYIESSRISVHPTLQGLLKRLL